MVGKPSRSIADVVQGALLHAAMSVVVFVAEQQLTRRMGRKGKPGASTPTPEEPDRRAS